MKDDAEDLDHLFELWGEEKRKRGDPEEHPSPERLTAYQANELSPEEDEKIQEHLAACQECAVLLLGFEELFKPQEARPSGVADFETAAGWRRLREKMREEPGEREYGDAKVRPFVASLWNARGLAALLALAIIGLGIHDVMTSLNERELRKELKEERETPLVNPGWTTLEAGGTRRSRGAEISEVPEVRLPTILALRSPDREARSGYRLEFLDSGGRVVRSANALEGSDPREVLVVLGERSLNPGTYSIRLLDPQGGQEDREVGRYTFRVAPRRPSG